MSTEFSTTFRVEKGVLKVRNRKLLEQWAAGLKDCEGIAHFEKAHATRSGQANRYYWGVIIAHISEHTGYTPEETHECLKQMFLPKKLAMLGDNGDLHGELVIGGSTSKLNTVEFYEYCSRIREFALLKLNVDIPNPDSVAA